MSLISAFLSRSIWLQRNASSEVNELRPFIEEMRHLQIFFHAITLLLWAADEFHLVTPNPDHPFKIN